jgi:hypothetical protein
MMMEPVHLYAAFLDVLAYRDRLEQDRNSGNLDLRNNLTSALRVFENVNDSVYHVQAISDTVLVTCLQHENFLEFLELLRNVFVTFMEQMLFVRGAVAYSQHFQSNRLTYSHAVARAYELESEQAVYPRIVIDENIIRMYEVGENLPDLFNKGLLCKENNVYFLDILTADNWNQVFSQAALIYKNNIKSLMRNEKAFSKHLRFERYLLRSQYASQNASTYVDQVNSY